MKKICQVIFLFFYYCLPSISAEVSVEKFQSEYGEKKKIVMRGIVEPGDILKFKNAVDRDPSLSENEYDPDMPRALDISGEGGDYTAAIEISKLVHTSAMRVFVPENQICQGPCAIILMAGRVPSGDNYFDTARCLQKGSKVIFGVPAIAEQLAATANQGQLARNTRLEALQFVIKFVRLADDHLWPSGLLDAMLDQEGNLSVTPESKVFVGDGNRVIDTYKNNGAC